MASPFTLQDPIFVTQCPGCAAVYALPAQRMGPAGARIRCPGCERVYDLRRPGAAAETGGVDRGSPPPSPVAGADPDLLRGSSAEVIARIVVEEIGDAMTRDMVAADAESALFARHGATLLDAFDRYRERAGAAAPGAAFLRALRDRLGIDLPEWRFGR